MKNESPPESKAEAERAIDAWARRYLPKNHSRQILKPKTKTKNRKEKLNDNSIARP
jgi:hypothetical protein